jgi:hypothetical protein
MYNLVQETLLITDSNILWIALDKITHKNLNILNGEWTVTITRQDEKELAMFGE